MNYPEAIAYVISRADMERGRPPAAGRRHYTLDRMRELLRRLGNPHLRLPAIHVAGTKGKGSTAAMVESILTAAGYRMGFYTSPHLHAFRERFRLGQEAIDEATFAQWAEMVQPAVEAMERETDLGEVTTFEILTAMAFVGFIAAGCRYQVLEVGLGGRLDATNLIERSLVSILTSISLDHMAILGNTISDIAADKSHVIKPGCPAVTAPQLPDALAAIRHRAAERGAPLTEVGRDYAWEMTGATLEGQSFRVTGPKGVFEGWIPLLGRHQLENAACALAACRALREQGVALPDDAIHEGFRRVRWPGRVEVLRRDPLVVVDGAHNGYSMDRLRETVESYLPHRRLLLVFAVSADKDLPGMVRELAPLAPALVFTCRTRHPRSRDTAGIAAAFREAGLTAHEFPTVAEATQTAIAMAGPGDLILGTGSLFTVGEMREELLGIAPELYEG